MLDRTASLHVRDIVDADPETTEANEVTFDDA
jgi:hypothetical protein